MTSCLGAKELLKRIPLVRPIGRRVGRWWAELTLRQRVRQWWAEHYIEAKSAWLESGMDSHTGGRTACP